MDMEKVVPSEELSSAVSAAGLAVDLRSCESSENVAWLWSGAVDRTSSLMTLFFKLTVTPSWKVIDTAVPEAAFNKSSCRAA
jgi:hypothetical protein